MNNRPAARPSRLELETAIAALTRMGTPWAIRRCALLRALAAAPQGDLGAIAKRAGTRRSVVERLLSSWFSARAESLTRFGRPLRCTRGIREALRERTETAPPQSIVELKEWLAAEKGIHLSIPTVRAACREFGYHPPCRRPPSPRQHFQWTPAQVAELERLLPSLGDRVRAMLMAGTQKAHLHDLAAKFRLSHYRLREDLRAFGRGKPIEVQVRRRHPDAPDTTVLQRGFCSWCETEYSASGKVPTGKAAQKFLRARQVELRMSSVYAWLVHWRQNRKPRLEARRYVKSNNYDTGVSHRHDAAITRYMRKAH